MHKCNGELNIGKYQYIMTKNYTEITGLNDILFDCACTKF